ncbi:hypothetical protein [Microbispora sp. CA-102843]|uniref:hypothetical protein n=1 Tax=Microbispora sp. CA-102843 TaxID=3239952 RepID=UPI003D8A0E8F
MEIFLSTCLILYMLYSGFWAEPGLIMSWPMYARRCAITITFELQTEHGDVRHAELYDVIPPDDLSLTPWQLIHISEYLQQRYPAVSGEGKIYYADGERHLKLENQRVVLRGIR